MGFRIAGIGGDSRIFFLRIRHFASTRFSSKISSLSLSVVMGDTQRTVSVFIAI